MRNLIYFIKKIWEQTVCEHPLDKIVTWDDSAIKPSKFCGKCGQRLG